MIYVLVLVVQVATMLILGAHFFSTGQWRLGVAQALLAAVTAVLYSDFQI
jgi:hypothetical protein